MRVRVVARQCVSVWCFCACRGVCGCNAIFFTMQNCVVTLPIVIASISDENNKKISDSFVLSPELDSIR